MNNPKSSRRTPIMWAAGIAACTVLLFLVIGGGYATRALAANEETHPSEAAKESAHEESDAAHGEEGHEHVEGEQAAEEGHEHENEGQGVTLSEEEMANLKLVVSPAENGLLPEMLKLPGEVRLNEDTITHVSPRLPGVVVEVQGVIGGHVEKGQVLAVLESRALADAQAAHLAARAKENLAQQTFEREKGLWEKQISAEKDYREAAQNLEETRIATRAAEENLQALGVTAGSGVKGTRYPILAPASGEIIEKNIALGQVMNGEETAFVLADLSTVWVDVNVFQKDLAQISPGQKVVVSGPAGLAPAEGAISYIAPMVNRDTRTVLARIILPNDQGVWRPGLFLDAEISLPGTEVQKLLLAKAAIQRFGDSTVVFVKDGEGFRPQPVTLGREYNGQVEVLAGLQPGDACVTEGAFELKAKMITRGMGSHAGHNH